jgi:hypothetical protein
MRGKFMKLMVAILAMSLMGAAFASEMGISTHPFTMKKQVITTEFNNYFSSGNGMGLTARYYRRLNETVNVDLGAGFSDGDRSNRIFAGADLELFPDYGKQPRVSIKGIIERQELFGDTINSFGFAPSVSKGFSFWGKEGFPYLALPMRVALNTEDNTYVTTQSIAAGITGRIPMDGFENLIGNVEINSSLRNSYTGIVMGISLPIQ